MIGLPAASEVGRIGTIASRERHPFAQLLLWCAMRGWTHGVAGVARTIPEGKVRRALGLLRALSSLSAAKDRVLDEES
jgi:hypothetical protein